MPTYAATGVRGVPNFQSVNDQVYRGGQPTAEGFRELAAMGVKTIVDLQEKDERSHAEHKLVHSLGMHYVNIPMKGMTTPKDKQISHALKELKADRGPVFIHCHRGADRTGVVLACYRIEHDNWSREEALREARSYGMSWYQFPLQRYVMRYQPHSHGGIDDLAGSIRDKASGILDKIRN